MMPVSEVHKQWGNEKRECMCLSLSLSFSLGPIKNQAARKLARLYIALIEKKEGRLYIYRDKIGRGEKFCHKDQDLDFK